MKLERCELSSDRKRLSGQTQARGVQTGTGSVVLLVFGLPFAGIGAWGTLAGTRLIPIDPSKLHAPYWVLAAFGIVFLFAGLMVWSLGWRQWQATRRRQRLQADHNADPALADYPWQPRGFTPPRWSRAVKGVGGAVFFALFLSMFNWWAFFAHGPWPVKAIVGLFDLILLFVIWQVAIVVGRTLKFGASRIEFVRFPFRPGQTVGLHWIVPTGVSRMRKGVFTLRCVEEWYETRGTGNDRSRTLVQEQVWGATGFVTDPRSLLAGKAEELQFDLPADARSTSLSGDKTVFWELAVELDLAGLDFKERYLVPVYRQV
jgi:hypothetical protein